MRELQRPPAAELTVADYLPRSEPAAIKFIQALNFTKALRKTPIELVVIHAMDGAELADKAETVALRFAGKTKSPAPRASYHYGIDCDSIVQCVLETNVAWHAPGSNHNGIGIEHAGLARQTKQQWLDNFSKPTLLISAGLTARICKRYQLPVAYVDHKGLLKKKRGITTHADVTKAFNKSTHTDPGPHFPMTWYLEQVQTALALV